MKKKVKSGNDVNNGEVSKQKLRHIVSWSQEVRQMILFLFLIFQWFFLIGYFGILFIN